METTLEDEARSELTLLLPSKKVVGKRGRRPTKTASVSPPPVKRKIGEEEQQEVCRSVSLSLLIVKEDWIKGSKELSRSLGEEVEEEHTRVEVDKKHKREEVEVEKEH